MVESHDTADVDPVTKGRAGPVFVSVQPKLTLVAPYTSPK